MVYVNVELGEVEVEFDETDIAEAVLNSENFEDRVSDCLNYSDIAENAADYITFPVTEQDHDNLVNQIEELGKQVEDLIELVNKSNEKKWWKFWK